MTRAVRAAPAAVGDGDTAPRGERARSDLAASAVHLEAGADRAQEPPIRGEIAAIVPSVGASPWLDEALGALRADGELRCPRILVWQGGRPAPALAAGDRLVHCPTPLGFAAAVNLGLAQTDTRFVAVVNDDARVAPGWLSTLVAALAADRRLGAVQGVNLAPDGSVDGCGIGWNRWLQAVQLHRGAPPTTLGAEAFPLFGVSATAAVYRRGALAAVTARDAGGFDTSLGSYYEDVELAVRLRAGGWQARCVPRAQAVHLGSASFGRAPRRLRYQLHRNRWFVLAEIFGANLWWRVPYLVTRDGVDAVRALSRGELSLAAAISAGTVHGLLGVRRRAVPRPRLLAGALRPWVVA
jgi:GT2 family glycosyltransferase